MRVLPILMLIGLAGVGAALGGCQKAGQASANAIAPATTPYTAVADGKADVDGGIISVAARTAGVVRFVYVQEGDSVTKGEVLARQEDGAPRPAVATSAAALAQAKAQIALTDTQLASAEREVNRLKPLMSARFVSSQSVDQAGDAGGGANATLQAQRAMVDVASTQLDQARHALHHTNIRAPIHGQIV